MKFTIQISATLFAALLIAIATPAQAHGSVESIVISGLLMGFLIAVALVIVAIIVGCVLFIVISLWRWRLRYKAGDRRLPRLIIIPMIILTCIALFSTSLVGSVWINFIFKQISHDTRAQDGPSSVGNDSPQKLNKPR